MRFTPVLTFALVVVSPAAMASIPSCKGGGPKDAVEAARAFSVCLKGGTCTGLGQAVFNNADSALPKAKKGYEYREAKVGADNAGGAGKRRLVFLIEGTFGTSDAKAAQKYFTDEHYAVGSFCSLP